MNSIKLKIIDLWKLTCYLIECSFIDAVISNFWQKKKLTILQDNVTIIYRDTENSLKKNTQYSVLQHSYSVSCMHLCYWKLVLLVFASIKYWMLLSFPGGLPHKKHEGCWSEILKKNPKEVPSSCFVGVFLRFFLQIHSPRCCWTVGLHSKS